MVLNLTEASRGKNFINLITDLKDDLTIKGNLNELEQAFINIVNNSKDILSEKDKKDDRYIFITSKKIDDNTLEIKILDNGGGLKEDIIDRIFEPYFTTKHKSMGTGLGLSMADKIIRERHNGSIKVHNEEFVYNDKEFKGACFTILFKTYAKDLS
ncbi:MAG: HAMP domain-containing sensor histidine kinase [Campylobacterota bacterium]|nr:HAMP domain-containing sensor histidine kinase [Campylobacterota bacterium]